MPALREAIQEEEALSAANDNGMNKTSNAAGKRKAKSAAKGKDGEEKIDGRAGPRSENVVLSKSEHSPCCRRSSYSLNFFYILAIDYINEIMDERRALLARLHRARSSLPPGHPALIPSRHQPSLGNEPGDGNGHDMTPLWEREWKGGHGSLDSACGDDDDSS